MLTEVNENLKLMQKNWRTQSQIFYSEIVGLVDETVFECIQLKMTFQLASTCVKCNYFQQNLGL